MSIVNSFIFDSADELVYDASKVEVITTIDDESSYNPFSFSGSVGTFGFSASGSPYVSTSGEIISFDFSEPRKLKSITVEQSPVNHAVSYKIRGGLNSSNEVTLINVSGSVNSGNIYHLFSNPLELRYVDIVVYEVPEFSTTFTVVSVSGEANAPFTETKVTSAQIETITATSNVEPVENLYDSDALTFWQSNNSYPQEVIFKLREVTNLSKFEYVAEDSTTYPTAYTIYKSLDGSTYDSIYSSGSISATSGSITFNPLETAKYLKWKITGGNSNKVRIREVSIYKKSYDTIDVNQVRLKKTVSDVMALVPSLSSTTANGANVVSNLIAGVDGYWQSTSTFTPSNNFFVGSENITFTFTSSTTIDNMVIKGYANDGLPVDFQLLASVDNSTFDVLADYIGNAQENVKIAFAETDHNEYLFYKLVFTKSTDAYVKLKEINFNTRTYPTLASVVLQGIVTDSIKSVNVTTSDVDLTNRDIKYTLNIDNRNFWFAGNAFVQSNGTFNQANTLDDLNANFEALTLNQNSKVALNAILSSNGMSTPVIESASMTSKNLANAPFIPSGQIRIRGYIAGHVGKPLEMTVSLKRPVKIDGQIVAYSANIIKSDNQGYFDFTLPCTETAVPAKEKFVVVVQPLNYRVERYTPNQTDIDLALWLGGTF